MCFFSKLVGKYTSHLFMKLRCVKRIIKKTHIHLLTYAIISTLFIIQISSLFAVECGAQNWFKLFCCKSIKPIGIRQYTKSKRSNPRSPIHHTHLTVCVRLISLLRVLYWYYSSFIKALYGGHGSPVFLYGLFLNDLECQKCIAKQILEGMRRYIASISTSIWRKKKKATGPCWF